VFDPIALRLLTVITAQDALAQLNALIAERDTLAKRSRYDDLSDLKFEIRALGTRIQAAIDRLTVPTSTHAREAERQRDNEQPAFRLIELVGIATALRDDIAAGWLESVAEVVRADTYNDYLEMADGLLGQRYKDAAAVIAGTSLEVHMKSLATKHGVSLQAASGSPKTADALNSDLKKAGVYSTLEQKQVTAWQHLRNLAAHGDYGAYTYTDVRQLIDGARNFAAKYPA
jgi:hypothetical protein